MKSIYLVLFVACTVFQCSANEESENAAVELITELCAAILRGNVYEVQSVIDRGVQLNYKKFYPLHYSIEQHLIEGFNEEIFKLLIKNGANLEVIDALDRKPLDKAVLYDNVRAVKILLESRANPNTYLKLIDAHNRTYNSSALQKAFLNSHESAEIVELLIEYGVDVNQTDANRRTPLHETIIEGHRRAIEMLIERRADVNAVDDRKMTPLHYIAFFDSLSSGPGDWTEDDRLKYAKLLINSGADLYAKAFYRKDGTPLDMATSSRMKELLRNEMDTVEKIEPRSID